MIVAGAGLVSNLIMGKILHSQGIEEHRILSHIILHPEDIPRLLSKKTTPQVSRTETEMSNSHEKLAHEERLLNEESKHNLSHEKSINEEPNPIIYNEENNELGKRENKGTSGNMNVRAALIHVFGDLCQSIGVIIAGLVIFLKPDLHIFDPICTFLFSIIVFFTTIPIIKDCVRIIMEGTPPEIDTIVLIEELKKVIKNQAKGVVEVHDLHVWTLSIGKYAATCHLISTDSNSSLIEATQICQETYGIKHCTFQIESPASGYDLQCSVGLHSKYID